MKKVIRTCLLPIVIAAFTINCKEEFEDYKSLDFETFQLEVPSDWEKFTQVGYDSQVGGITNGRDTLNYDFGWYSYKFTHQGTDTHLRIELTIDGRDALIVRPKKRGEGVIGVLMQVDELNTLSLYGKSRDEDTILRIFETITAN